MAQNEVTIHINAKDEASKSIDKTKGNLAKLGGAAGLAGAAAAAGLGVFAAASVKMAAQFESSMSEVKTLLPQMDDGTFEKLGEDLRKMSAEMGIATTEAVPALYSAISAGVPPDNVISFMESAAKAAVGGMTTLETAVNGITTVVNSYGESVIDATTAGDVMFSAVKDGKTNFEELSGALAVILPIAASLGVPFEEVAASISLMTSMGMATKVSSGALRAMFVEATKSGTLLDDAIQDIGGASMGELISSGETAASVMQKVRLSMPDQAFRDLFGSVEASGAALMLTGDNYAKFETMLDHGRNSAGALDEAFETVAQTATFKFNKAMITLKNMMLEVGLKILPLLVAGFEYLQREMVRAEPYINDVRNAFLGLADSGIVGFLQGAMDILSEFARGAVTVIRDDLYPAFMDIVAIVREDILPLFQVMVEWEMEHLQAQIDGVGGALKAVAGGIKAVTGFLREHSEIVLATLAVYAVWKIGMLLQKGFLIAQAAATSAVTAATVAMNAVMALSPFGLIVIAIALLVAAGIVLWKNWDTVSAKAGELWNYLKRVFSDMAEWITDKWAAIRDAITAALDMVAEYVSNTFDAIVGKIRDSFDWIVEKIRESIDSIIGFFTYLYDHSRLVHDFVDKVVADVTAMRDFITDAWKLLKDVTSATWEFVLEVSTTVWTAVSEFITDIVSATVDWITGAWETVKDVTAAAFNAVKDVVLEIVQLMYDDIKAEVQRIVRHFAALGGMILDAMGWAKDLLFPVGKAIALSLLDGLKSEYDRIVGWANAIKNAIMAALSITGIFQTEVIGSAADNMQLGDGFPEMASGGVVRARPGGTLARIGEGGRDEAIIPLGAGGIGGLGSTTNNITINLSGVITDPVATGQAVADALNRASITTGPLVLSGAVQ